MTVGRLNTRAAALRGSHFDDLLASMPVADKVGQLFIFTFTGPERVGATAAIAELRAGGIVLLANAVSATGVQRLTSGLQQVAQDNAVLPLLLANNHEGGTIQPIRGGVTSFGTAWSVGQIQPFDAALAAACVRGRIQGRELQRMGLNMNLAPVLDVWDNPRNTIIGERSFGSDPKVVAGLGAAYIEALQAEGVLAVGKHFPGHGSSTDDSHLTLPVVRHDRAWLDEHELVPFRAALAANIAAIMTAHVNFPLLDAVSNRPASFSPEIVSGLLRTELGFDGLIVTDDLGSMQAITGRYEPGEAAVKAVQAGSDVLIVVGTINRQRSMVQALIDAVATGEITEERLNASVRRVLRAKQAAGLLGAEQSLLDQLPNQPVCGSR